MRVTSRGAQFSATDDSREWQRLASDKKRSFTSNRGTAAAGGRGGGGALFSKHIIHVQQKNLKTVDWPDDDAVSHQERLMS